MGMLACAHMGDLASSSPVPSIANRCQARDALAPSWSLVPPCSMTSQRCDHSFIVSGSNCSRTR
eukprot:7657588-Alexandrium_andersonii.AAC.1